MAEEDSSDLRKIENNSLKNKVIQLVNEIGEHSIGEEEVLKSIDLGKSQGVAKVFFNLSKCLLVF